MLLGLVHADSWKTNSKQNATQIFYFVNNFHDWLNAAPIGFTEAAGNFELTNSTGQGVGGDPCRPRCSTARTRPAGFPITTT